MSGDMMQTIQRLEREVAQLKTQIRRPDRTSQGWALAISLYLHLPGLLGLWPGARGISSNNDALRDVSGAGIHLGSVIGGPTERVENTSLRRWVNFGGGGAFYTPDTVYTSPRGNEGAVVAANRGLTVMAWVRPTTGADSFNRDIISKWDAGSGATQRSWRFFRQLSSPQPVEFQVSSDGATNAATVASTNTIAIDQWRFVAARWTPSSEVKVWEGHTGGLTENVNTTSVPSLLFDSTAPLAVGVVNVTAGGTNFWLGDMSLIALCRVAVPDIFINTIFGATAPLFGATP